MTVYSLKKAFPLRITTPLEMRLSAARIFYFKDLAGLIDNEVLLWPVKFKENTKIKELSYLTFQYSFQSLSTKKTLESSMMIIEKIIHISTNTLQSAFPWLEEKFEIPFPVLNETEFTKLYLSKNHSYKSRHIFYSN